MDRFIPTKKLGKKARRELDTRQRKTWLLSPVTRTVESGKKYNRHRAGHDLRMAESCFFHGMEVAPCNKTFYNSR